MPVPPAIIPSSEYIPGAYLNRPCPGPEEGARVRDKEGERLRILDRASHKTGESLLDSIETHLWATHVDRAANRQRVDVGAHAPVRVHLDHQVKVPCTGTRIECQTSGERGGVTWWLFVVGSYFPFHRHHFSALPPSYHATTASATPTNPHVPPEPSAGSTAA